jgi:hypothetical protein
MKTAHTLIRYLSLPDDENMIHDYGFNINYNKNNLNSLITLTILPEIMTQVNMVMAP